MKKEEAKAAQERNDEWDNLTQWWDYVEREQEQVEAWRRKLEEHELAVAAREAAVFQRELEYRRLERCPLCGKRGRINVVQSRRAGVGGHRGENWRQGEAIAQRTAAGVTVANAALERRNDPKSPLRAGQLLQ